MVLHCAVVPHAPPGGLLRGLRQSLAQRLGEEDGQAPRHSGHHAHDEHRGRQPVHLVIITIIIIIAIIAITIIIIIIIITLSRSSSRAVMPPSLATREQVPRARLLMAVGKSSTV